MGLAFVTLNVLVGLVVVERLGAAKFAYVHNVAEDEDDCDGYEHERHEEVSVVPRVPFVHALEFVFFHGKFYCVHVDFC